MTKQTTEEIYREVYGVTDASKLKDPSTPRSSRVFGRWINGLWEEVKAEWIINKEETNGFFRIYISEDRFHDLPEDLSSDIMALDSFRWEYWCWD